MRFNIILAIGVLVVLLVGVVSAGVSCDSAAEGDGMYVATDYTEMVGGCALQSQTAYSAMVTGGGAYQSSMAAGNGFAHITQASLNGMFRNGMSTVRAQCDSDTACNGCDTSNGCTYSQAMFGTRATGNTVIQSTGYVGNGMSGESFITGTGTSKITAGSMDVTKFSESTFSHSIRSTGFSIKNRMKFDWMG